MIREKRYTVLKDKDIESYLSEEEQTLLDGLCWKISQFRQVDGKQPLQCVVVESDWPEYEPTWALIEKRVDNL